MGSQEKTVHKKSRGRPAGTNYTDTIPARLTPKTAKALGAWAKANDVSRSEAIRRLVELGLSVSQPRTAGAHKGATTAADMAGEQINRMGDQSVTDEQRQSRKRRLLKGPKEFREDRRDQTRAKKR